MNQFYLNHFYRLCGSRTEAGLPVSEIVCYVEHCLKGIIPGEMLDFVDAMIIINESTKVAKVATNDDKTKGKK